MTSSRPWPRSEPEFLFSIIPRWGNTVPPARFLCLSKQILMDIMSCPDLNCKYMVCKVSESRPDVLESRDSVVQGGSSVVIGMLVVLYLAIADFLFFAGWTTPVCLFVFCAALFAILLTYCKSPGHVMPMEKTFTQSSGLCISVLIIGVFFVIGGVVGWFPTHGDSWAFRQALFLNLKDAAWPLVLPDGREMTYYLAGMLPAAMLGRVLPECLTQWAVWLWIVGALTAMLLVVSRFRGTNIVLFTILALGFQDPLRAVFRPNATFGQGRGFMAEVLQFFQNLTGVDCSVLVTYYGNQTLMAPIYNCVGAYNSVPAALLAAMALVFFRRVPWMIPVVIGLLVPISPLGAIACMPVAAYYFLSGISWRRLLSVLFPLFVAGVSAVYFLRADSSMNVVTAAWIARGPEFWIFYVRYLVGSSFLLVPLYPFRKKDGLYWIVTISAILMPCLFIGSLPDLPVFHGFNEFFLKGSVVYSLFICLMWCQEWSKMNKYVRAGALLWAVLSTVVYCSSQIKGWDAQRTVADMWNGHLYHNRVFLRQSVPSTKAPAIPGVILQRSGESLDYFPGGAFPEAKGVDYSGEPHPQAFP